MTVQQCRYVLEIAKTGSFSEAAKQLFVAQSSLSVSIKALEGELGIKIFERSTNGVYLTDEGSEFVKYASKMVDSEDFISERYKSRHVMSRLSIVTQHYDFIADIFGNFLQRVDVDNYRFSIKEIETYSVIGEVLTGSADVGIIAMKASESDIMKRYLDKKGLTFRTLLKVPPHVFVRYNHPLAKRSALSLCDLQSFPYVSYEQGEHSNAYFTEEMLDSFAVGKHIEISDRATLMNLLLITDAYTVGTGIMSSALNRGDIVSIPLESDDFYVIGYILNETRRVFRMTDMFINELKASIETIANKKGEEA